MRSINSPRLKGSQAFCGDPSAKRVSGWTGSQSSAVEHASDEALWRCAAIHTEYEVSKLSHSSDSGYPEFHSTTSSPRFLFAKEKFLKNLADQNSTISLNTIKRDFSTRTKQRCGRLFFQRFSCFLPFKPPVF